MSTSAPKESWPGQSNWHAGLQRRTFAQKAQHYAEEAEFALAVNKTARDYPRIHALAQLSLAYSALAAGKDQE